jgi:truncated hemoglobin YjbI
MVDEKLFEQIGGRPTLERVHKLFYDKLYEHPWLKHFFSTVDQKVIEDQQTDFMTANMGGGKIYFGGIPKNVHKHMFINEELFDLRSKILRECIIECGVSEHLAERWINIDYAFKHSIVKKDAGQCEKRYFTDEIINISKPEGI